MIAAHAIRFGEPKAVHQCHGRDKRGHDEGGGPCVTQTGNKKPIAKTPDRCAVRQFQFPEIVRADKSQ